MISIMMSQSSPTTSSSDTSTPTSAIKLTYTTAGTPYNPNTSQPLQPPARRGRSLKFSPGGSYAGLSLLPKSILATLPIKRTSPLQYSPLQQNLERAVSPMNDPDHLCANMSAQVPRLDTTATPPPLASLLSGLGPGKYQEGDEVDESDDESDLGMDPLLNMTVKSLQNLASYPNPNQKRAQKALLRGVKPALASLSVATRSQGASAPLSPIRPIGPPDSIKKEVISPIAVRPAQANSALERLQQEALWRSEAFNFSTPRAVEPQTQKSTMGNGFTLGSIGTAPTALASGPGAPRPLTAGPPGQRQYRPSTFESTFKALQAKLQHQHDSNADDDEEFVSAAQQAFLYAGLEDTSTISGSPSSAFQFAPSTTPDSRPFTCGNTTMPIGDELSDHNEGDGTCTETEYWGQDYKSLYNTAPVGWNHSPKPPISGPINSQTDSIRVASGFELRTEEQVKARRAQVENVWYAGADFLAKSTNEDSLGLQTSKTPRKAEFGAIGEGRPQTTQDRYPPFTITEANSMTIEEHAQPLLNMAFRTVQRFVDGKPQE